MVFFDGTLNYEERFIVGNILTVHRVKITFTKCKIVDSIQQIGFTHTVIAHKAIDPAAETGIKLRVVFKINKA